MKRRETVIRQLVSAITVTVAVLFTFTHKAKAQMINFTLRYHSKTVAYRSGQSHIIKVHPDIIALKGVTVSNRKPPATATGHGLPANVSGTPLASMGSVAGHSCGTK